MTIFEKRDLGFLAGILLVMLLLNVGSIQHKSQTIDEGVHYKYGYRALKNGDFGRYERFDNSKMPVTAFNALPGVFGQKMGDGAVARFLRKLTTARYMTSLFALVVALYVFAWSRRLYGPWAAYLSTALFALAPNIIAHSRLITTDVYQAGMTFIATYYFWRFLEDRTWLRASVSALTLGLCQLTKYSCVYLYPLFALLALIHWARVSRRRGAGSSPAPRVEGLKSFGTYALLFVLISVIVINFGFQFFETGTPWGDYEFKSDLFRTLQARTGFLAKVPVPLPYPWLHGLDWVRSDHQTGATYGNLYLLGELRHDRGFAGYYLVAFLYKVPLATQLAVLLAAVVYGLRRREFDFFRNELFLLIPVLFFTVWLSFFFKAQIGIRYFLVVLPFLHVFCGSVWHVRWEPPWKKRWLGLCGALVLYQAISVLSYFPHYISYFNELVWDRKHAYEILADSNVDWRQNQAYLRDYRLQHPDSIVNPDAPTAGRIIVGINELVGVLGDESRHRWLRENFEPDDHIAYSYLVYEIDEAELAGISR